MNNIPSCSKSKKNEDFEEDEIFDDSSFLAKFDNSFKTTSKPSESNINDSIGNNALNVSALCCDEEMSGYDKLTGKSWIYPTNYPVRDYQFNIIKAAILKNTLVSLPTGLGKTFIAAVIMYNFYRWYPLGKIVFTAPTRPLVAQQIEACYNIIAIPPNDTIEMTGHMQVNTRKANWQNKRVFFATPQVIYNDMKSGICPCDKIRCLVVDEAHRARGNYAYCQIVSTLDDVGHKIYRLLALSATPGSKVEDVINVVKNLHIAHLELRTENCIDVAPYSHARRITTVVIQLGRHLTQLRQQYVEILDGYARRLKQFNILPQNLGNLSKGRIVMLYKEFQSKERGARHPQHNYIMKDFTVLIALYHGLELLSQHGSRVFLNFFDEHPEKSWIQADDKLTALLERLRDDLGINPLSFDRSILPDGTMPEMPNDLCFGHPKFDKLKEIMMDHFKRAEHNKQDTRAIVFCEYRESVNLVHCLLLQCRPHIKPQMFVGQGASGKDGKTVVSQKQQLRVMRAFREGACNTLVATCVAEEGLDVGSVDLILCFDISTRSPIRLVQRCGRTGRERGGQVYILVTEGREHQTLMDCMRQRDGLNKKIQQSKEVENNLYKLNPRMMPRDFTPQCQKMFITVEKKQDPKEKSREDKVKKGQKDLRSMLLGRASSSSSGASNKDATAALVTEDEFKDLYPEGYKSTAYFVQQQEYWAMSKETIKKSTDTDARSSLNLSTWLEWQRTLQKTVNIGHSRDAEILSELLQYSDAKRFEMPPSTQNPCFGSQETPTQKIIFLSPAKTKQAKKKQKIPTIKSPAKRDGDIRALFSTATKSTKSYTKLINDLGIQNDGNIPTRLISLLVDLTLDNTTTEKKCYICQNICQCSLIQKVRKHRKQPILLTSLNELNLPDINLIDDFDANTILKCAESKDRKGLIFNVDQSIDVDDKNCTGNFDLEFDFDSQNDFNSPIVDTKHENVSIESDKNFEIGDIDDIFADSSPEQAIENAIEVKEEKPKEKVALEFFGLDSIEDIFADDDIIELTPVKNPDPINSSNTKHSIQSTCESSNKEHQLSPSILSGKSKTINPTSPILCSQVRKFHLSRSKDRPQSSTPFSTIKRQLIKEPEKDITATINPHKSCLITTGAADTSDKSMFTITQLVEMINKTDDEHTVKNRSIQIEIHEDNRSNSPILLTQADRKRPTTQLNNLVNITTPSVTSKKSQSLIVLDSDSDSDNTQIYDPEEVNKTNMTNDQTNKSTVINCKRKLDTEDSDTITSSPYFCKKQKLDAQESKQLTLQEKVLAAISSNKFNKNVYSNDKAILSCSVSQPTFHLQKENQKPTNINDGQNKLEMLQIFRRDSKLDIRNNSTFSGSPKRTETPQKRKLTFDDSDDDFVIEENNGYRSQINGIKDKSTTNHKVRKKQNKRANEFLDMEAALSDDDNNSGDELTDDSVGSIADFICDENVTHHEDIQAVYLKSIKSPIKGGAFKIPELPKMFNREDILSQYVADDTYEMDSFCVDSHIGLTQVNDVSELELAEIALEHERQAKKNARRIYSQSDSPVVKRNKLKRRQIESDSDDSS